MAARYVTGALIKAAVGDRDSAADCLGLLDHLEIERAVVGGMSQGGFLSLRVALTAPDGQEMFNLMQKGAALGASVGQAHQAELVQMVKDKKRILDAVIPKQ